MARIGTNMTVEVENTLATGLAVSAVTKANPGVATATGHSYANGDILVFTASAGMVELDGQAVRVANTATAAGTFELESLDTSAYSTWTAGTVQEVTAWHTIAGAQNITMPNPAPNKIDITTLIDKTKQYAYGLADAPDGTISGLYDPTSAGVVEIKGATKANEDRVFRVSWAGGQYTIFNANVSGGTGFDLQQNGAATSDISFTPVKDVLDYAS